MKQKFRAITLAALCAFTGSASAADPMILHLCRTFFKSGNQGLLETSNWEIGRNAEDYDAYVRRAIARVAALWWNDSVNPFLKGCGLTVDGNTGVVGLNGQLGPTLIEAMQEYDQMEEVCRVALPVFEAAIEDLGKLPADWSDGTDGKYGMEVSPDAGYEVDDTIYFDYADAQLLKAFFCEALSILNLVKGYRDPVTWEPGGPNPEALEEARRWQVAVGMQVKAFNAEQKKRTGDDVSHFFEITDEASRIITANEQNLLDVPYWSVRVELEPLTNFVFKSKKRKDALIGRQIDISLRGLFEGRVSKALRTFPEFNGDSPLLGSLVDSTLGGTFPGMSRNMLGEYAVLFGDVNEYGRSDEIKEYAVLYRLPAGAENNPGNPATYGANPKSAISLLDPTMEGYSFAGWSNDGLILPGTRGAVEFVASFLPEGSEGNPWKIGATTNDTVTAWTNGTTLVIEGRGAMKDFGEAGREDAPRTVAPWGTGITNIDFGAQVTNFGANAFAGCAALRTLTMRGNPPAIGGNDLSGVTVIVREDALAKFQTADGWTDLTYGETMKVCYDWQNVKTLAPFLHEVWFDDYTFDEKGETLGGVEMFSCSSVRNGNFIGRNFDFFLDDKPEFVVHVAANPAKGRLASVAMAMHTGMREDGVTNGQYTASYDLLPNRTLDGINEKCVAINQNVVAYDPEVVAGVEREFAGTNPGAPDLNISFVTRMVLDRATNAAHAVELIKSRNLFGMSVSGDILHYMISDPKETYVVEIITNTVVERHFTMMTNFAINWDNEHTRALTDADNETWTRDYYPEPSNLVVSAGSFVAATNELAKYYARHAEGVERFVRLRDHYDDGATFEGMASLMRRARYSQASTFETQPYWYSDRCSVEVDKQLTELGYPGIANTYMLYGLKYYKDEADPESVLTNKLDEILDKYFMANERECLANKDAHRKDDCGVWLTVHNTTYDISNRMFRVAVQENYGQMFDVDLDGSKPVRPKKRSGLVILYR